MIATVAFSMGIDCPDVYQVFNFGSPENIDRYVQGTGRAGLNNESLYEKAESTNERLYQQ